MRRFFPQNHNQKKLPTYFHSFKLTKRSDIHQYNTRQKNKLEINKTNTIKADIRNALPTILNSTDKCIIDKVHTHSLKGFTWYFKQICISKYQDICLIDNCIQLINVKYCTPCHKRDWKTRLCRKPLCNKKKI